eukprot:TRINITY_DN160_c0_g3_i4.p2 TRINITY_DN160_c0_g3~~TRINITY_DN160_c0_g3_i4.p2  ORF type:complete len:408 (-),score=109.09 TRINITY_DN160_c0_g3_i4:75-1298(-)
MPSLSCIFTLVAATVCVLVPGVFSGLILVQNMANMGVGVIGKPLPNGLITSTTDITKAVPIGFDPTQTVQFGIQGYGGGAWAGRHHLAMVVPNADTTWNSIAPNPANRGALVVSSVSTAPFATPATFSAAHISASFSPATHKLETAVFRYNSGNQQITARWCPPTGGCRTAMFVWDPISFSISLVASLTPGDIRVTLHLVGSYTISNIVFDPHFRGFNGLKYDVQGQTDTWFNLLSDQDIQFNGFFQSITGSVKEQNTYVRKLGVALEGHTILINSTAVELDGAILHKMGDHAEVEEVLTNSKGDTVATLLADTHSVTFHTPAYFITIAQGTTTPGGKPQLFFNVEDIELLETSRQPHGLLGQTAHAAVDEKAHRGPQGEGVIEGVYTDYIVSSAFGTDFKYNKFTL